MSRTVLASQRTCTTRTNGRKTLREHRCGAGQKFSEGQVRIRPLSYFLKALERVN